MDKVTNHADDFRGDNAALIASIDALLDLEDAKVLVPHGLGGKNSHAYRLLCAAKHRLATPAPDSEKLREAYLVWSNEHQAWWGKNRCGYTRFIDRAGRYDRVEALSIAGTRDGGWHVRKGNPDEIAIPERDAIDQYASITQSQRDDAAALGASL